MEIWQHLLAETLQLLHAMYQLHQDVPVVTVTVQGNGSAICHEYLQLLGA